MKRAPASERGGAPGPSAERETWTPWERIRTLAEFDVEFAVFPEEPFLYQDIGPKALELFRLGMSYLKIAEELRVTDKTVAKGIRYVEKLREAARPRSISPRRRKRGVSPFAGFEFPFDDVDENDDDE